VGSGNSSTVLRDVGMSEEMFDDGFESITNIDISQGSVKTMNERCKDKGPNFKYIQMDVRALDFPENSFDAIIDKGTFDSIVVSNFMM
jgi:ubiquinone/menaquinone biosynthesis C-methylase UbiE